VRWHGQAETWGGAWKENDVVGCLVRLDEEGAKASFSFSLNGSFESPMGIAFENVPLSPSLRPAITFNKTMTCKIRLDRSTCSFRPPPGCDYVYKKETDEEEGNVGSSATPAEEPELQTHLFLDGSTEELLGSVRLLKFVHSLGLVSLCFCVQTFLYFLLWLIFGFP